MKLSFVGTLSDKEVFIDADTGAADQDDRQTSEPIRLRKGAESLSTKLRNQMVERFFDYKNPSSKSTMLREVGIAEDEITRLLATDQKGAWRVYEQALEAKRERDWEERDKRRPHLNLWGYRRRMIEVEGWEGVSRDEVMLRVKHFVLSTEAELARLQSEVARFERFEQNPPVSREPIPEDVQAFVWRRDAGRCVKCGSQERLEFDHIIPLAKGGSNTERNIQLLCEFHNREKGVGDLLFPDAVEES